MNRQEKIMNLGFLQNFGGVNLQVQRDSYIELNTFNLDLTSKLYRIIGYDKLIDSLKNKCLYMMKPTKWKDEYETFLLNGIKKDIDGSLVSFDLIKNKLYFQCWSKYEESGDLWKACSLREGPKLVKIKTSGDKLMKSLYDINNPSHRNSYFIGSVDYVNEEDIRKLLDYDIYGYFFNEGESMIKTLFIKREKYAFENEVRLLFYALDSENGDSSNIKNGWDIKSDIFSFEIDINDVIEEIVLHPGLNNEDCAKMIKEIKMLGYNGIVCKSTLFS